MCAGLLSWHAHCASDIVTNHALRVGRRMRQQIIMERTQPYMALRVSHSLLPRQEFFPFAIRIVS